MTPENDPIVRASLGEGTSDADSIPSEAEPSANSRDILSPDVLEEEIPIIGSEMLHHERVDLELGMKVLPPFTIGLIVACILVYVHQLMIGGLDNGLRVIETGAMNRPEVLDGQLWRLVSAGFMHANEEHLFSNMGMLYILGMASEHAFGRGPFLFLYVIACLTGSLLAMSSDSPMVGASGAIFGLAGALIAMVYTRRRTIELRDHRVGIVLAIWSIFSIGLGVLDPIISNSCHLGGFLGGLFLGGLLPPAILSNRKEFARRPVYRLEGLLALTVLVATACFFLPRLH